MKIVIIGPGAIGCLIAGFLSKTKEELWLLDKDQARAAQLNRQGIRIEGVSGSWQAKVRVSHDPHEVGPADLVILCVKSYDTKDALAKAKPLIGERTFCLTVQNGIGNVEMIAEVIDSDQIIAGITNQGATLLDTGIIRHAGKGETILGLMDGKLPVEMRTVRDIFNKCGFEVKVSRDIKGILWSKLIINVGINALTALTHLPNGSLVTFEGTRRIMRDAATEAVKIAKRKRIKLVYDDPLAKVESVCEATASNVSSMLQDILREKRTEIDLINGVIVRLGQELGIPTPVNALLVDLIKTVEQSYSLRRDAL